MNIHDAVRLRVDLPEEGVRAGSVGVIVAVFDVPTRALEVEFADENGRTIAQITLRPDEVELVEIDASGLH